MSKFIAVQGCVLVTDNATAQARPIDPPSMKVKAGGKGVYKDKLTVEVTLASEGPFQQTAPMTTVINTTSTKIKAEGGIFVLLEGDKSNNPALCVCVAPDGSTKTVPVKVTIQHAGQTKLKGN